MVREWVAGKTVLSLSYHGPYLNALAVGSSHNNVLYNCLIALTYLPIKTKLTTVATIRK